MKNITEIQVEQLDGSKVTHIIIDRGNNEFTSMPKELWDELEAAKEANKTLS